MSGPVEWVKGVASLKTRFAGTGVGFPAVSPPVTPPPTGGDAGLVLPQTEAAAKAYWAGATEYFCSPTGGAVLSTNSGSPGGANHAVNNAPTRSIITLLDSAARYPQITDVTGGGRRLWIRAQTPAFTDINTSVSPAVVIGIAPASAMARVNGVHLEGFGGSIIEGCYADVQDGGNFHVESCTGQSWIMRCRTWRVGNQAFQLTANTESVVYKCWGFNDKLAVNAGGPADKSGWRTDYGVFLFGAGKYWIAGSYLEGAFNQPTSAKEKCDEVYISGSAYHLWAQDTYPVGSPAGSGTKGGIYGILLGQTGDGASDDNTIGRVDITNVVWSSRSAYFINFWNCRDCNAIGNTIIRSGGISVDAANYSYVLKGTRHPRNFLVKNNTFQYVSDKILRGMTYSNQFNMTLETNTTPTTLAILNTAPQDTIPASGSDAAAYTTAKPTITRVGGNACGFGAVPA